jgi:hypothetical protein
LEQKNREADRVIAVPDGGEWSASWPRPPYTLGKNLLYPFYRRLGGLQSRSGRGGEEKNSQPIPGLEIPIIQPVVYRHTAELSWLRFTFPWHFQ